MDMISIKFLLLFLKDIMLEPSASNAVIGFYLKCSSRLVCFMSILCEFKRSLNILRFLIERRQG